MFATDVLGPEHRVVIDANQTLGMIYLQLGMGQEANQYLKQLTFLLPMYWVKITRTPSKST